MLKAETLRWAPGRIRFPRRFIVLQESHKQLISADTQLNQMLEVGTGDKLTCRRFVWLLDPPLSAFFRPPRQVRSHQHSAR